MWNDMCCLVIFVSVQTSNADFVRQFTSTLLKELCELLWVDQIKTTAYNPQANGIVEWDSWSLVDQGSLPGS